MITATDFNQNLKQLEKKVGTIHINSVMIEQAGKVEMVINGSNGLQALHSCAKVLVSMAVGIAIENKMLVDGVPLNLETEIFPVIKKVIHMTNEVNIPKIEKWTIGNLLTHTTGYEKQMLSGKYIEGVNKDKLLDYALNYVIPYEVGNRYAYNNVEPYVIAAFFQEAFKVNLSDFVNENIFKKLGITEYQWMHYGKYCAGATGLFLRHADFHKIGQLLLYSGTFNNNQVVPSKWIADMCTLKIETPLEYKPERLFPKIGAGYFTFISRDDFVFRDGSNGQYIIFNKQKNLLITILSSEPDMKNVTEILRDLI